MPLQKPFHAHRFAFWLPLLAAAAGLASWTVLQAVRLPFDQAWAHDLRLLLMTPDSHSMPTLLNRLLAWRPGYLALAVFFSLMLVAWLASGEVQRTRRTPPDSKPAEKTGALPRVETRWQDAVTESSELVVQGQVEPWRSVEVRAQVNGLVETRPLAIGSRVKSGELLLKLATDDRAVQLARATADLQQREAELAGGQRLHERQLVSDTELLRLASEKARAAADFENARLALRNTRIRAPFSGQLDKLPVESGDFVQSGQSLLTLVDITRLKITAQVAQQNVAQLQEGQRVAIELLGGDRLSGRLDFIASAADSGTRSFRIEASAENPQRLRVAGGSATLRISLPPRPSHRISPALLVLDTEGRQGVYIVDAEQRLQLQRIELLGMDSRGAHIAGLPAHVQLVTRGAGFVAKGSLVEAIASTASETSSTATAAKTATAAQPAKAGPQ